MRIIETIPIALNALRTNKLRTILTMLGIIIGILAIVLLLSIALGARKEILGQIQSFGTTNTFSVFPGDIEATHGPPGAYVVNRLTYRDAWNIKKRCKYKLEVAPFVVNISPVNYLRESRNTTFICGTTPEFTIVNSWYLENGRFLNKDDLTSYRRVCVIGSTLLKYLFKNKNPIDEYIQIKGTKFKVIGYMKSKGRMFDMDLDDMVLIPLTTAQRLFGVDYVNEIDIWVENVDELEKAMSETRKILLRRLDADDFSIKSDSEFLSLLKVITGILTAMLGSIAGVSLIVGGIGIMNIMLVSVTERTREIGIRKAVGANELDILFQFLIESVVLAITGGIIGIIISYLLASLISSFAPFKVTISYLAVAIAIGFSGIIGIFFGVYPASKAARLDPIEALRYE